MTLGDDGLAKEIESQVITVFENELDKVLPTGGKLTLYNKYLVFDTI